MPLFICEKCKNIENTALGSYWAKEEKLCSKCARGEWHNKFPEEKFDPNKWEIERGDFIKLKEI